MPERSPIAATTKTRTLEVLLQGLGGQGILFIGRLLAEAGMSEFGHAAFFPNYGALMRGGPSECVVVLSDQPIASPILFRVGTAIVMGQAPSDFQKRLRAGGLVLLEQGTVARDDLRVLRLPATDAAYRLGDRQVANLVFLGAYLEATGAITLARVEGLLERKMAGGRRESLLQLNKQALREGALLAAQLKG